MQNEKGKLVIWIETPEGDEEIELPTVKEVCWRCNGNGRHDHPAFSNGLSQEDFDEDPDFFEDYMSGAYDVPCEECNGANVIDAPDFARMSPELTEAYWKSVDAEAACRRESESERRFGA